MKKIYFLMLCLCGLVGHMQAQITGFTGAFSPSNWQLAPFTDGGNASINYSGAPSSVIFTGSNDPANDGFGNIGAYDLWQITVGQSGTISFTYRFQNNDTQLIEYASYLIGTNETIFAPQSTQTVFNGTISNATVTAGQVFAFKIFNNDDINGNGVLTISNFSFMPSNPLVVNVSQTNVFCKGGNTGSATVSVSGGQPPYSYSWSPSGGTGATASGLVAGTYTCTVKDVATNTVAKSVTITEPSVLAATTSQTNISCNGGNNGSATVSASGGTSPYSYLWSPSGGTGATASNLSFGNYSCTITDSKGCSLVKSFSITQPAVLVASTSQTNVSCNGGNNGNASVVPSGGTTPYLYSWSPGGATSASVSNLAASVYNCTVTDAKGCSLLKSFTITQPTVLTAATSQTNVSCSGGNDGTASVVPSGGTAPYAYQWSPSGGSGATASGLVPGNYSCTITDSKGCVLIKSFAIIQSSGFAATTSQVNVSCNGGNNGSATVTPSGGAAPYLYSWTPSGGTGATASGLTAGNYVCTITDGNGCVLQKNFTITEPAPLTATTSQTNVSCNGGNNGSASVAPSGGTSPYSYLWSPGGATSASISGLTVNTYACTITDSKGCTLVKNFNIAQPVALTAMASQTNVLCNGDNNASATVAVSGGTPSYSYQWTPSGGTGASAFNLSANNYACTITDSKGCVLIKNFTIVQPELLAATTAQTDVSCNGGDNASATVIPSGGTPPYVYSWTPSGGTSATASRLTAGNYACAITDKNGCVLTKSFVIAQPAVLTATTSQKDISCNGAVDGSASVVPGGGTPPYFYLWSPSGEIGATTSGLSAGNHICTITDSKGCVLQKSFVLAQPSVLAVASSQVNVSCNGGGDGSVILTPSGATLPYQVSFNGDAFMTTDGEVRFDKLEAGQYSWIVRDANGCAVNGLMELIQPQELVIATSHENVKCNGGKDGSVTVSFSGGVKPYQLSFNGGAYAEVVSPSVHNSLAAGTYGFVIKDKNGCSVNGSETVSQPLAIQAAATHIDVKCNGGNDGSVTVVFGSGVSPYQISFGSEAFVEAVSPFVFNNLTAGAYDWTVKDGNGCMVGGSEIVGQPNLPVISQNVTVPMGDVYESSLCLNDFSKNMTLDNPVVGAIQWQTLVQEAIPDVNSVWVNVEGANSAEYLVINPQEGRNWFRMMSTTSGCESVFSNAEYVYYRQCLSVEKMSSPVFKVEVYPVPYKDVFSVKLTTLSGEDVRINIFDMAGRLIDQRIVTPDNLLSLKLGEGFPSGVYNLMLSQGQQIKTLRVIKQ